MDFRGDIERYIDKRKEQDPEGQWWALLVDGSKVGPFGDRDGSDINEVLFTNVLKAYAAKQWSPRDEEKAT